MNRAPTRTNWFRRHPIWSGLIGTVAVFVLWLVLGGRGAAPEWPLIAPIARGTIENVVAASGELHPIRVVRVGAQVSGQIRSLHVQVGDRVVEGIVIAEIDAEPQEKEIEASRANLRGLEMQLPALEASLAFAEASLRRQERLMAESATAEAQYDQAVSSLAQARASLEQHRTSIAQSIASIEAQETRLAYSTIRAPISGTVSEVMVQVGQTVIATQQTPDILEISDISAMEVRAHVSEADVRRLTVGMPIYFTTLGDNSRRWHSELRQVLVSPVNRNGVIFYPALFEVGNSDGSLLPDMTAEVYFVLSSAEDVLVVPLAALTIPGEPGPPSASALYMQGIRPDLALAAGAPRASNTAAQGEGTPAIAWAVDASGEIFRRELRIGARDLVNAEVLSGLAEGEQVVTGARSFGSPVPGPSGLGGV